MTFKVLFEVSLEGLNKVSFITNDSIVDMCTDDTDISFEKLCVA
jgi:hypothetical protein